jgi:hypothetical protein
MTAAMKALGITVSETKRPHIDPLNVSLSWY